MRRTIITLAGSATISVLALTGLQGTAQAHEYRYHEYRHHRYEYRDHDYRYHRLYSRYRYHRDYDRR